MLAVNEIRTAPRRRLLPVAVVLAAEVAVPEVAEEEEEALEVVLELDQEQPVAVAVLLMEALVGRVAVVPLVWEVPVGMVPVWPVVALVDLPEELVAEVEHLEVSAVLNEKGLADGEIGNTLGRVGGSRVAVKMDGIRKVLNFTIL